MNTHRHAPPGTRTINDDVAPQEASPSGPPPTVGDDETIEISKESLLAMQAELKRAQEEARVAKSRTGELKALYDKTQAELSRSTHTLKELSAITSTPSEKTAAQFAQYGKVAQSAFKKSIMGDGKTSTHEPDDESLFSLEEDECGDQWAVVKVRLNPMWVSSPTIYQKTVWNKDTKKKWLRPTRDRKVGETVIYSSELGFTVTDPTGISRPVCLKGLCVINMCDDYLE